MKRSETKQKETKRNERKRKEIITNEWERWKNMRQSEISKITVIIILIIVNSSLQTLLSKYDILRSRLVTERKQTQSTSSSYHHTKNNKKFRCVRNEYFDH